MLKKDRFYYNEKFLGGMSGRPIRILSEYLGPLSTLQKFNIKDTIVFFGSARLDDNNKYYKMARELSFKLTKWNLKNFKDEHRYIITSGAGPGIMEAANKGANEAGGKSVGFGISLPFEQTNNKWVTKGLNFIFHYFFMRKFWFIYLAKALVVWPGGFGTLDEVMELLTLIQTKKIKKRLPIVLYGTEFWNSVVNWDYLVDCGTISEEDLDLFIITDSVDESYDYIVKYINEYKLKGPNF